MGGERCEEEEFDAAVVSVGPVESGLVEAGSTLEEAPIASFLSCSSTRTSA